MPVEFARSFNFMKNTLKFLIAWVLCTLFRLIPGRPPNMEPILAIDMPFGRRMGALVGFMFSFANMFMFDIVTGHFGVWTWVTSTTYGMIGLASPFFFRKLSGVTGYISYSIIGILTFDLITGVLMGPLLFGGSFAEAFIGQIPFTGYHLLGGILFAGLLSPIVDSLIVSNARLELPRVWRVRNPSMLH